jgi:hypothetical protein
VSININYARNGDGNSFMHKYWYNNHHIEVNLESRDMLCDPSTTTHWEIMQFIGLQIRYNELYKVVKVHAVIDAPCQ